MTDQANFTVRLVDKVKGPARTASKAVRGLFGSFRGGAKGVEMLNDRMGVASAGMKRLERSSSGVMSVLGGNLLAQGVTQMLSMGAATAGAAAGIVTFGQNSELAFGQLAKHGASAADLMEHASSLAQTFGLDVMDTAKQYQKFLALQFDPKGIDTLMRLGADLRALGTDAEGVQGVFMALGQIKGKGRVQSEELLQLAERGVSTVLVQEEIGKLLGGKDTRAVQALMQQGKVDAEIGLAAIEKAIVRKLGEAHPGEAGAKYANETIDGILGRFQAFGQTSGMKVLNKVAEPITDALGRGLGRFTDFLDSPQGVATIGAMANAFGRAAEGAVQLADAFGGGFSAAWGEMSKGAAPFFEMLGNRDSTDQIQLVGRSLGQVAALGVGAAAALGVVAGGVAVLGAGIYNLGVAIVDGFAATLGTAIGRVMSWWDTLTAIWDDGSRGLITKAWDLGVHIVMGLANGIMGYLSLPLDAIANVGSRITDTIANVLGIHSPSRVMMDMGLYMGDGLALGMQRSEGLVAGAGADMASASIDGAVWGPSTRSLPADAGASSRGTVSVNAPISIEVYVAGGDANEVAEQTARSVRREVEAIFRQLALEV